MSNGIGGHSTPNRGQTNEWLTPPEVIRALGRFDLDPCCPPVMPWQTADRMIHEGQGDGLAADWGNARVWCNPPYGEQTGDWLAKLATHGRGIALVFARTETKMFTRHVWPKASAVLFVAGRLYFHRPDGTRGKANAGGPSVLIAYGDADAEILRGCGLGQYLNVNRSN